MVRLVWLIRLQLVFLSFFYAQDLMAQFVAQNSRPSRQPERSEEPVRRSVQRRERGPDGLIYAWGGLGLGVGYFHSLSQKIRLGGEFSMQTNPDLGCGHFGNYFTNNLSLEYVYNLTCKVTASNLQLNAAWTSNREDGILLAAGLGLTQVSSSLTGSREMRTPGSLNRTTLSISDSGSALGASIGLKAGYIYSFDGGFTLGLLGHFVHPSVKLDPFKVPSEKAPDDGEIYAAMDQNKEKFSASGLGLLLGYTF